MNQCAVNICEEQTHCRCGRFMKHYVHCSAVLTKTFLFVTDNQWDHLLQISWKSSLFYCTGIVQEDPVLELTIVPLSLTVLITAIFQVDLG